MTRMARPPTFGADEGYDSADFVMALRGKTVVAHVARNTAAAFGN
jgi:hypothetical protein